MGNVFSLMAVVLVFTTVWASLVFYRELFAWVSRNPFLHTPLLVFALVVDVLLILAFFSIGSQRADEPDDSCFATFKG